jgi:hypothetical protein
MALGVYFVHMGFTPAKYDTAIKQLDDAGAGSPKGRLNHFALEDGGMIQVFDVWESMEDFEAFGATLVPILTELGVELAEPSISPIHNTISG